MTGNRGIAGIIAALKAKIVGSVNSGVKRGGYVPAPRRAVRSFWDDTSRYRADNLPAIRKRNGVGRPPAVTLLRRDDYAHWIAWPSVAIKPYLGAQLGGWNTDTPNRNLAE